MNINKLETVGPPPSTDTWDSDDNSNNKNLNVPTYN